MIKQTLLLILSLLIIGLSGLEPAQSNEILMLKTNTLVEVKEFDPESQTYDLKILSGADIGPNIVTPEDLMKASKNKRIKKNMKDKLVGRKIFLNKDLNLITGEEVSHRIKTFEASLPQEPNYYQVRKVAKLQSLKVTMYDPSSRTYLIETHGRNFKERSNYVTLENLAKSVRIVKKNKEKILLDPKLLEGKRLFTKEALVLASQAEVDRRESFFFDRPEIRQVSQRRWIASEQEK